MAATGKSGDGGPPAGSARTPARPATRDPARLADALATAMKACAVWPRSNPRVRDGSERLVQLLQGWVQHPDRLEVRLRGSGLSVGDHTLAQPSQVVEWLIARCRDVALAGFEFAAGVDAAVVVDFGVALAAAGHQHGGCTVEWPAQHPLLRPLELVFDGSHEADASHGGDGSVSIHDARKAQLMALLQESAEIQSRLRSFEQICGDEVARDGVVVDVLKCVLEMLPMEIACDAEVSVQTVARILAEIHVDTMAQLRTGGPPDDQALMRTAMAVARNWFINAEGGLALAAGGTADPPGHPEITADADALLADLATLPDPDDGVLLTDAASCRSAAELCGILMHVLLAPHRAELTKALLERLPLVLADLHAEGAQVLDAYLQPSAPDQPAAIGDAAAATILQALERAGRGRLIVDRGYLDAGFVRRTFPGAFPTCARLLGQSHAGIATLREGLDLLGRKQLAAGAELLGARNALADPVVLAAVRDIGGERVLPIVRCALASDSPAVREGLIGLLRSLPLPAAEAAALRCLRPPAELPAGYLAGLCRLLEERSAGDARLREQSGKLLRDFVNGASTTLPADVRLRAVSFLELVPGPETEALLRRLARRRWLPFQAATARALRDKARAVLAVLRAPPRAEAEP